MEWKDIITQQHFISLLEKHFFPRWIQVCVVLMDSWSIFFSDRFVLFKHLFLF